MKRQYFSEEAMRLDQVDPGKVSRKIKAYGDKTMMVEVYFEQGGVGAPHSHRHEQLSYCLEGAFDFAIGDEKYRLKAGDSVFIPRGTMHGVLCLAKGRLLDMFSPPREDFLA
jgi:quercetin dioxygenase-like cupin family protein